MSSQSALHGIVHGSWNWTEWRNRNSLLEQTVEQPCKKPKVEQRPVWNRNKQRNQNKTTMQEDGCFYKWHFAEFTAPSTEWPYRDPSASPVPADPPPPFPPSPQSPLCPPPNVTYNGSVINSLHEDDPFKVLHCILTSNIYQRSFWCEKNIWDRDHKKI